MLRLLTAGVARDVPGMALFQSSYPFAIPLALGWIGILGRATALGLATLAGVVELVGWGFALRGTRGYGAAGIAGVGAMNAAVPDRRIEAPVR
jgi:hypothetical protein